MGARSRKKHILDCDALWDGTDCFFWSGRFELFFSGGITVRTIWNRPFFGGLSEISRVKPYTGSSDVLLLWVVELAQQLQNREISPVELLEAVLVRAEGVRIA